MDICVNREVREEELQILQCRDKEQWEHSENTVRTVLSSHEVSRDSKCCSGRSSDKGCLSVVVTETEMTFALDQVSEENNFRTKSAKWHEIDIFK